MRMSVLGIYFYIGNRTIMLASKKNFESRKSTAQNWKYVELCKKGKYFNFSIACQLRIFGV